MNIGEKIKMLRQNRGITQKELAEILLISPQAVSKWETGKSIPDVCILPQIAGFFEVSISALFD